MWNAALPQSYLAKEIMILLERELDQVQLQEVALELVELDPVYVGIQKYLLIEGLERRFLFVFALLNYSED